MKKSSWIWFSVIVGILIGVASFVFLLRKKEKEIIETREKRNIGRWNRKYYTMPRDYKDV